MRKPPALVAGVLGVLVSTTMSDAARSGEAQVVVTLETVVNTLDASGRPGCLARGELAGGGRYEAWVAFAAVKAEGSGWEAVTPRTDCGGRRFDQAGAQMVRTFGIPYLIVDVETVPPAQPAQSAGLVAVSLRIRKLTGFDSSGRPIYTPGAQRRTLDSGTGDELVVPLLIADQREKEAFGIAELFLRLSARDQGRASPASYGAVWVTADVPGIGIFLDGGLVGRTREGAPTTLANVLVGARDVRVKDLSGREAGRSVVVEKGRTAAVALKILNLSSSDTRALVPIGKNPQGHDEYWRVRDGETMVRVPAGEFTMGSPDGQGEANERPQRSVFLSEFLIDKTEVTWRQFRKFAQATGAAIPPAPLWGTPDDYPVVNVLWDEANAFCAWAGGRLPTEAQWEKAARGVDARKYPWGDGWDADRCNTIDGGPHRPEVVGGFPHCVSPYGALDMVGSVWEWTADWYASGYQSDTSTRDPSGPAAGKMRVLRGGAWINQPSYARSAYRARNDPAGRMVHYGFRCARSVPE